MAYAIGLCVDEGYLVPALATITSLADTLPPRERKDVAIRVLTLDMTRSHAQTMAHLVRQVGFGSFDLRWCTPSQAALMVDDSYISVTTYLRFHFTPDFVGREYLIYVDADTQALGDISAPLHDLEPGRLGVVQDEFIPAVGMSEALPGLVEARPEFRGRTYYNAGMLWAPTRMLAEVRKGIEQAMTWGSSHIFHNDQDALNLWLLTASAAQQVDGAFNRFELSRFLEFGDWTSRVVHRPASATASATLVHFVGPHKPWQTSCPGTEDVLRYRGHLARTMRQVRRLGDQSIEVPGGRR